MAYILAIVPGMSIEALDRMSLAELNRWQEHAARIDRQRAGPQR